MVERTQHASIQVHTKNLSFKQAVQMAAAKELGIDITDLIENNRDHYVSVSDLRKHFESLDVDKDATIVRFVKKRKGIEKTHQDPEQFFAKLFEEPTPPAEPVTKREKNYQASVRLIERMHKQSSQTFFLNPEGTGYKLKDLENPAEQAQVIENVMQAVVFTQNAHTDLLHTPEFRSALNTYIAQEDDFSPIFVFLLHFSSPEPLATTMTDPIEDTTLSNTSYTPSFEYTLFLERPLTLSNPMGQAMDQKKQQATELLDAIKTTRFFADLQSKVQKQDQKRIENCEKAFLKSLLYTITNWKGAKTFEINRTNHPQ